MDKEWLARTEEKNLISISSPVVAEVLEGKENGTDQLAVDSPKVLPPPQRLHTAVEKMRAEIEQKGGEILSHSLSSSERESGSRE